MINLKKSNWELDYGENLDFESLKSKYSPPHKFRVSEFHYPAGEIVDGSMRTSRCFVMTGTCSYKYRDKCEVELKSGEYVELPDGAYQLTVGEQNDLHIVVVWEIPALVNWTS